MVDYDTTSESTERQDLLIEARSLEKSFHLGKREILVLKKIDLQIFHHEFIAIVGPSGAGKSTLLHLLGMLEVPSGGEVQILGHPVNSLDEKARQCCAAVRSVLSSNSIICYLDLLHWRM